MDFLVLNDMQFHAFHGVHKQEQKIGNTYFVDLKIGGDFKKACQTDQIEDALDYGSVFYEIQEEMKNSCRLIEHLAENICKRLRSRFTEIQSLEIKVTKQNPPLHGQLESVSIILFR
jgi:7,8-dihydroneopterin aldolase/epimerase/oxygenase